MSSGRCQIPASRSVGGESPLTVAVDDAVGLQCRVDWGHVT